MEPKLIDTVIAVGVAIVTAIGAIVIALKKFNLITFRKPKVTCMESKTCLVHPEIVQKLSEVKNQQIINTGLLKQHVINFEDGRIESKEIKEALKVIGENIAVLRDRSDRAIISKGG